MKIKVIRPTFTSRHCFMNNLPPEEIQVWILRWRSMTGWIKENWGILNEEEIKQYTSYVKYEDIMRGCNRANRCKKDFFILSWQRYKKIYKLREDVLGNHICAVLENVYL